MSLFRKIDGSPLWSDDYEEIIDDERDNRRILSLYDFSNGKRDNKIEKEQLNIIDNAVELLQKIYSDISFKLIIPSHTSGWYIIDNGKIYHTIQRKKNLWFDSKTFDAILEIEIDNKNYDIFFVLKGVENQGGHQTNVLQEMGLYIRQINNNVDDNVNFIFLLDGKFIESKFYLVDDSTYKTDKFILTNSSNVRKSIETILKRYINE